MDYSGHGIRYYIDQPVHLSMAPPVSVRNPLYEPERSISLNDGWGGVNTIRVRDTLVEGPLPREGVLSGQGGRLVMMYCDNAVSQETVIEVLRHIAGVVNGARQRVGGVVPKR